MDLYAQNRRDVMKRLPDGLIAVGSAPEILRNGDVNYFYRQASNFLYLTGIEQPGFALLLDPRKKREILFVPKLTQLHAVWLGHIPSKEEAAREYGIQDVRFLDELPATLKALRNGHRKCYAGKEILPRIKKTLGRTKIDAAGLDEAFAELRAVKKPGEIKKIRKANQVTTRGHLAAMRAARPGMYEYEVQAELEREFLRGGLFQKGYSSIVAGGKNSAVLHYHHNHSKLKAGDLLLIDAGAECLGYTADVTRTFPVSGKFTRKQKDVYEAVLAAHKKSMDKARPGITSLELHQYSCRIVAEGLRNLGILKGSTDELVESEAVRVFYPHGLTHMLGLDVHDVQGGKKRAIKVPGKKKVRFNAKLEPGFVITIEPGIYFIPALLNDPKVRRKHAGRIDFGKAEKFLDFGGIRIENDVLVREKGPPKDLTSVPREVKEIEKICSEG